MCPAVRAPTAGRPRCWCPSSSTSRLCRWLRCGGRADSALVTAGLLICLRRTTLLTPTACPPRCGQRAPPNSVLWLACPPSCPAYLRAPCKLILLSPLQECGRAIFDLNEKNLQAGGAAQRSLLCRQAGIPPRSPAPLLHICASLPCTRGAPPIPAALPCRTTTSLPTCGNWSPASWRQRWVRLSSWLTAGWCPVLVGRGAGRPGASVLHRIPCAACCQLSHRQVLHVGRGKA